MRKSVVIGIFIVILALGELFGPELWDDVMTVDEPEFVQTEKGDPSGAFQFAARCVVDRVGRSLRPRFDRAAVQRSSVKMVAQDTYEVNSNVYLPDGYGGRTAYRFSAKVKFDPVSHYWQLIGDLNIKRQR